MQYNVGTAVKAKVNKYIRQNDWHDSTLCEDNQAILTTNK